ncbi:MAG TPA: xanthine dehydrogenase family protein subunit M [Methylomirabilota bacterium]|nr:xanthine dehydrogenase family protein subunit M [Methylomirabilota bacterium]
MKPAPFRYARADSLAEATALLAAAPGDTKLLAGGQSLVPMLNMRLVRPAVLVDVNGLRELTGITPLPDGGLRLGALTRHAELAASPLVRERAPLLAEAARHVGHAAIRNQGTLGGSVAHADPAAELPAALLALDARVHITGPHGAREVAADAFFRGLLTTALEPEEILTAIEIPAPPPGWGFVEIARRPGDFALAGVAVVVRPGRRPLTLPSPARGGEGIEAVRLVGFGVGDRTLRLIGAERVLGGGPLDAEAAARAGAAAGADCDPPSDVHGSAEYRRHLATVLTERALLQAAARLAGHAR